MSDELGLRLKMARLRAKLEQSEVAERLGTHRVQVSKWERGVNRPGDETLERLAAVYRTSTAELLRAADVPRETTQEAEAWTPNPSLKGKIPERAYDVAIGYCRRLAAAGATPEFIEDIERLMIDSRYAQANKRKGVELSEDEWIILIDATWEAVKVTASWKGVRV